MTHFPAGGQSAGHGKIAEVSWDPWIVPRTNTCRHVIKVNLTLTSFTHFVAIRQIVGQWPPRWLSCCRLLLLLLRRWLWLPMTDRSSSERRSRRVRRRHRIQTVTLLNRNRRMSFITLSATVTASAFSTIAGRNWTAAAARLSSTTTLYDGPGPLTTSRFRIHVIPTATGCSPFLPTCNQNNENKIFEFIPIYCCFFFIIPWGSGEVTDAVAASWTPAGDTGLATFPKASTTVWTTGVALFSWQLDELCCSLDSKEITICPFTWSVSFAFARVKSRRWSKAK